MSQANSLHIEFEQQKPMPLRGKFSCEAGQLLALVGPSGAGKSSILRVLAGLMKPAKGRIQVGGQVWLDTTNNVFQTPQQRRVGLVFQNYALMPHLSAAANVALALQHLPKTDRIIEALQWLKRVRLSTDEALRKPAQLSGGQQQRVALARALARTPRLLLLDEPFSAVDQMNRESLYRLLAELRADLNIPIVLVTHDLNEARMLCDKLVVLDQGEVLQEGLAFDVHRRPRNSRVADLMGIQNRFHGTWLGPADAAGVGLLKWTRNLDTQQADDVNSFELCVKDKGKIPAGFPVNWVVHSDGLALKPEGYNLQRHGFVLVPVHVASHRDLGELSLIDLIMDVAPFENLKMAVPGMQRLGLKKGASCVVEMELGLIHIMPKKHRQ
ncbi:ABC transporter ATP-binding protein [Limnobacter parvus]|uniref:ATP-binding cassette domain-containing protein n=1 Tax=Limnobacter parvus TaxID=2939690 RepID=A0ABT1XE20_9BURK|nr:ATP-binding cassette domain-containing protein [Limnobacter parvus]MCR2745526.1 ATP-binding cassette domain-containing protein [Limnobacter parvus]